MILIHPQPSFQLGGFHLNLKMSHNFALFLHVDFNNFLSSPFNFDFDQVHGRAPLLPSFPGPHVQLSLQLKTFSFPSCLSDSFEVSLGSIDLVHRRSIDHISTAALHHISQCGSIPLFLISTVHIYLGHFVPLANFSG
jgi:hypothetical protein